ncbi:MAG TPA: helix-hairpin-helix domain-containing protein [Rhodothermales bacterium]
MEIRGLGSEVAAMLVESGPVRSVADLYELTADTLAKLDSFGATSAANLVDAIAASRSRSFARVLFGPGIRHVGEKVAEILVDHFRTLDHLQAATEEELKSVPGIGPAIATEICEFPGSLQPRGGLPSSALRAPNGVSAFGCPS